MLLRVPSWASLALLLAACGGDEASLSLRLLYPVLSDGNPPPRPWLGHGCSEERVLGECVAVKLSACSATTGECNPVLGEGADAELGTIVSVQAGTFDLPTNTAERTDLLLQVGMYGDGALLATGEARDVSFVDEKSVALTLFPVGEGSACGEPGGDDTEFLQARTFHTATLLPNGQILIAGGVSAVLLSLTPGGNSLEEGINVLDPRSGEVTRPLVTNEAPDEAGGQLYRAFHQAAYTGTDAEGRYVVRLFGGIRAKQNGESVWVSAARESMPLQLLVSGAPTGVNSEPAPPVDLHYDPRSGAVTITAPDTDADAYPRASFGGFTALTDTLGSDTRPGGVSDSFYLGGGLGAWTAQQERADQIEPVLDGFLVSANGGTQNASPAPLLVGRVGGTALGIGADQVLFWGGNVWSAEGSADPEADLAAEIAEIHEPGTADAARFVTVTGVAVPPTSFHAAAVAAVDGDIYRIVVAGGYTIGNLEALNTNVFAPVPLYLVSYDKARRSAVVTEVDCGAQSCAEVFGDVAYLTATWIAPGRVLFVGGNFAYPPEGSSQIKYGARAIAGVVTVTGDSAVFDPVDLGAARYGHTATRLLDGAVVILGGVTLECDAEGAGGTCTRFGDLKPLATYEVYNEGLDFDLARPCE